MKAALLGLLLVLASSVYAVEEVEFGDAPDTTGGASPYGYFPTLYNTGNARIPGRRGPFHLQTQWEWIGRTSPSTTTLEGDALVVDLDFDDWLPGGILWVNLWGIPARGELVVPITIDPCAPDTIRFLNVLIDQNNNLKWMDEGLVEWVVQNMVVDIPPGSTRYIVTRTFPYSSNFILGPTWIRLTLTREYIEPDDFVGVNGWDGSGPGDGFSYGETEDWVLFKPYPDIPPDTITPPPPKDSIPIPPHDGNGEPPKRNLKLLCPRRVVVPLHGCGFVVRIKNPNNFPIGPVIKKFEHKFTEGYGDPAVVDPDFEIIDEIPARGVHTEFIWVDFPGTDPDKRTSWYDIILIYDPENITMVHDELMEMKEACCVGIETEKPYPFELWETQNLNFDVTATQFWGDTVNLEALYLPSGATFPPVTGDSIATSTFDWTPGFSDAGWDSVVFRAYNNWGDEEILSCPITVVQVNHPPTINTAKCNDTLLYAGDTLIIAISSSDADLTYNEDTLFLSYGIFPSPLTTPSFVDSGNGNGLFTWMPELVDTGAYDISFYVRDFYLSEDTMSCKKVVVKKIEDVGVHSIDSPPETVWVDSTYELLATVKNYGNFEETFDVKCELNYSSKIAIDTTVEDIFLMPDSTTQVSFGDWIVDSAATYNLTVVTLLPTDMNPDNDTFELTILGEVGVEEGSLSSPTVYSLAQNSPNPFSRETSIQYTVGSRQGRSSITLKVYDLTGKLVRTLVSEPQQPGYYTVNWNGRDEQGKLVANGIYFYKLAAQDFTCTRKLILLR